MRILTSLVAVVVAALLLTGCSSSAPTAQSSASAEESASGDDFKKALAKSEKMDGLFTVYRDTTDGSVHLEISEDQLGKEFIYFTHTVDGVVQAGHFRGAYRDNAVFTIERHYDRIEFVEQNTNFYFDEESALARAAAANTSPSVLHAEKIVAHEDDSGRILIKADDLFLTDALHQVKPSPNPKAPPTAFKLGRQDKGKSKIRSLHNYPENTDVVVDYVFSNSTPLNGGGEAVTDARNVTITLRHSLIEMPDNDYTPRFADPRVGYFASQKTDQTSTSATPYHDLIHRWHLEKKDPDAELSEPVEPIVWWIENTTPERIRPIVKEAVLAWNEAFEAAGFRNAVQVKVQPDSATWDAGDIRYNVLRWTSSPQPPFGGYGPSFVNPRTGQILGSDIMLEYVFLTNRANYNKLFDITGLTSLNDEMPSDMQKGAMCSIGTFMHANTMFGRTAVRALSDDGPTGLDGEMTQLMEEGIYYLALHEVGHTLGLMHNMKASQLHGPDEVHNADMTRASGLTGSVMDYPAINVAPPETKQGQFYTTKPGPYDLWAIEYGYTTDEDNLDAILSRSTESELAFGNDADDMRSPGKAIDPRVMIGDMSADALQYAEDRMGLIGELTPDLVSKYADAGQSWQELRDAYGIIMGQHVGMMQAVSRYVGGVYVDRGFVGQEGAGDPYTPVPTEDQKRAVQILETHLFAPDAFDKPADLYRHLQPQRRGFEFFGDSEDPKIHAQARRAQESVLAHLLHPNTLERITDTRLYGNGYRLIDYMDDLTDAVFEADANSNVNTFRQNLQLAYVQGLAGVLSEKGRKMYDPIAQTAALHSLNRIEDMIGDRRGVNAETRAHTEHILLIVENATSVD
ncbi:hypothetical protein CRI94_07750 [Longibacter salinarum]|uniref:DUF5117 domain-containing protein n=1 Tax=Longibacter salinarum TaxID=1850348 RepID=A0A2A8CZ87_9BACT|nr:zinc-dependent metalloprotease [Longibacter salinarum]PEN13940.1 hypothetical protein CRI94_07750 [Longibacter salinarum]